MSSDGLDKRRFALEHEFFSRQNNTALDSMKARNASKARRDALADATGISDDAILQTIDAAGIEAASLTALSLVPLVVVAWADGTLDNQERGAIEKAAAQNGVSGDASEMLASWLNEAPAPALLAAWKDFVAGLKDTLDADAYGALRARVLGQASAVSTAAGGFLGLGNKTSAAEAAVIAELTASF
jgi:hypothetical protein